MTSSKPYPQERLDRNLLQDYYQALQIVDTQHKQVLSVEQELFWHESQLKKADELARNLGINGITGLPITQKIYDTHTDRDRVNTVLSNAYSLLYSWKDLKIKKENILETIEKNGKLLLENLRQEEIETNHSLNKINDELQELKTRKMLYVVFTVLIGILAAMLSRNFLITLGVIVGFLVYISFLIRTK